LSKGLNFVVYSPVLPIEDILSGVENVISILLVEAAEEINDRRL
jgi:hypothetical protein